MLLLRRKKKKKKKKNVAENAPNDTEEVPSNTPTYIKLPAEGENCVLLVSHDSFSNPVNSANNTQEKISNEKPSTVLIKNKDMPPIEQTLLQSEAPTTDSVSIIKVNNKQATKPSIEMTIASGLKKADDFLKSESKGTNALISNDPGSTGGEVETKTKAQLKAERRAIQEAQRAAKVNKNLDKESVQVTPKNIQNKAVSNTSEKETLPKSDVLTTEHTIKNTPKISTERKVSRKDQVFFHLPQYVDFLKQFNNTNLNMHPAILELGSHYSQGIICGSNARCIGFLAAFKKVIEDFRTPPDRSFSRELEVKLQSCLSFLNSCRTLSVSVFNVVKVIKQQITNISKDITEDASKENLLSEIDTFVEENIHLAMKAICMSATKKIVDGDTILVYSYSSLVKDVLCNAFDQKKSFHVIVVDSRPKLEGKEMLKRLVIHGLQCSYILIGAASYIMKKVSKVIIGAHALLSNGCVMSRVGSKQIALIASAFSVPVLVCCETYKFWERALTDSIVHNELGNSEDLLKLNMYNKENLQSCQDSTFLQVLNILYDVTPSDLITVVITEKGLLPCTSVPVVLRVKHAGSKNSGSGQT